MQKLEKFPQFARVGNAKSGHYDYEKLFNGEPWELKRDEDFHTKPSNAAISIRSAAKRRNMNVRIVASGTKLYVQAQK